jgi:hypothetical protein
MTYPTVTPGALLAGELAAALELLARLRTDELEVLDGLIKVELKRRRPIDLGLWAAPLLRFELASQPTAVIIAKILRTSFRNAETAIDLTPGRGCFWRRDVPITVTVKRSTHDFRCLPYADNSFDVALLDPPHVADAGADSIMGSRFGTFKQADLEPAVRQGTREAWRVARGVIVKVTDHVHGQRYVLESDWVRDALDWQPPYEVVHQVRDRALVDPRWRVPQLSARNNGSTYLIFRKDGDRHVRERVAHARSLPGEAPMT